MNLTAQECCQICKNHTKCTFAVFGSPAETPPCSCWLKEGVPAKAPNTHRYRKGATTCCPKGMACPAGKPPAPAPLAAGAGSCIPAPPHTIIGSGEWKTAQHPSPHAASAAACCDYCTANSKVGVAGQSTCKAFTYEPKEKGGAMCILKDNVETSRGGL